MGEISNRAIISRLYNSAEQNIEDAAYDITSWSECYKAVQALTDPEKMVYVMVKLNQKVTNGGFAEFYESSFGIFAPEIIHVLNEIKATETADIVSRSMLVVNPNGILDDEYKALVFNFEITEEQRLQLLTQDIRYDQLDGIENLEDLLGSYLQELIR
jgi:hypothetical protein